MIGACRRHAATAELRLNQDEATSDIPVVTVSIVDNPELGIAVGALDYFVKPVPAKELLEGLSRFNFKLTDRREGVLILVVDHEESNRSWLAQVLEPAGFPVIPAAGGREAIRLARSRKPDLVLLDLMMPGVMGFEVVEALRPQKATRSTSAIVSRGSTGGADLLGHLQEVVARRASDS